MFAKRLKEERERLGITQKEMALRLSIPLDTYKNYESQGQRSREPDLRMVSKIADVLDVSVDHLIGREK